MPPYNDVSTSYTGRSRNCSNSSQVRNAWRNQAFHEMPENFRHFMKFLSESGQQAIGYQKEIKKTLGKTSETDAYLKFEMTSYVKCQTDL